MGWPEESLPAIMQRTMKNLEIVQAHRDECLAKGINVDVEGPYEVTQLVNSVLGALVHPWELMVKQSGGRHATELDSLSAHLQGTSTDPSKELTLETRLGYVRNAFAHGNIEFLPSQSMRDGQYDIQGIRIWNCDHSKTKSWEIELGVDDLYELLQDFSTIARRLYSPRLHRRQKDCPNDPND